MTKLTNLMDEWLKEADYVNDEPWRQKMYRQCADALSPHIHREELYSELVRAARLAQDVLSNHINMDPKMYRKYRDAWEPLTAALAALEEDK